MEESIYNLIPKEAEEKEQAPKYALEWTWTLFYFIRRAV